MRILVTFAVEAEFAPWRHLRRFRNMRVNSDHYSGGVEGFEAQIGDKTIWILLTGMGIKLFDFQAASCFCSAGVNLVISSGLAGSLKPEIKPAELIAPRKVGNLRDASGVSITAAPLALAAHRGATLIETLLTSNHIVDTQQEKTRLAIFGEAVDMESFHIVRQFRDEGVPVLVVRAVSDPSDRDLPVDFNKCVTEEGRIKPASLFRQLLRRPKKLPELVRFGLQSRHASQKLAMFLDGLVEALTLDSIRRDAEVTAS
jgi:adenosylhomocysteine nucleosidase